MKSRNILSSTVTQRKPFFKQALHFHLSFFSSDMKQYPEIPVKSCQRERTSVFLQHCELSLHAVSILWTDQFGRVPHFASNQHKKLTKVIVAFNFQEAGVVFGILLGSHMHFHTVPKQGSIQSSVTAVFHFHLADAILLTRQLS